MGYSKIARQHAILETLSFRRHATMTELAEMFGVSTRTIYSDVLDLSREYPVDTKRGKYGCVYLSDNEWKYRPYKLNNVQRLILLQWREQSKTQETKDALGKVIELLE